MASMTRLSVTILAIFSSLLVIYDFVEAQSSINICSSKTTCGACMESSPECHWCSAQNYPNELRCDRKSVLMNNCSESDIINVTHKLTKVRNESARSANAQENSIQLSPQELKIDLRPNMPFQFELEFRPAENYPVDIYFIMDASYTMRNYAKTLGNFSHQLADQIRNITKDFRLGFGTFVDKTLLPYVATGPAGIIDLCNTGETCIPPYGFKNQLPLTANETTFKDEVSRVSSSSNLDAPEGGFDAIMQAAVCKEKIGWRDESRKMILLSTDGSSHYAGDGKLGGIVIPNDGNCHIDEMGYYSESTNQDYPSISQLAHKISEKKINLIFAVPNEWTSAYRRLSDHILGSNVGELNADSSNVIQIVKENYDRIRRTIELRTDKPEDVDISFRVACPDAAISDVPTCDNLGIGKTMKVNVTIRVNKCPQDKSKWKKALEIYPVGLTEKLVVNLDLLCECPCEQPHVEEPNSIKCNSSGTYECGICTCNRGFYGKNCECGAASTDNSDGQEDMFCRMTNTSDVCQGKGKCECGQCKCNLINAADSQKSYSGRFCECNDYNCEYHQNQICGGVSRGTCVCGKCNCKSGYSGARCECDSNEETCRASNGKICNDKGVCVCGVCECKLDDSYKGTHCEECPTCPGKCEQYRQCVTCHFREAGNPCYANCSTKVDLVNDLNIDDKWKPCQFSDEDYCVTYFAYNYETTEVKAKKEKSTDCDSALIPQLCVHG